MSDVCCLLFVVSCLFVVLLLRCFLSAVCCLLIVVQCLVLGSFVLVVFVGAVVIFEIGVCCLLFVVRSCCSCLLFVVCCCCRCVLLCLLL